jgi:hypothetical protein
MDGFIVLVGVMVVWLLQSISKSLREIAEDTSKIRSEMATVRYELFDNSQGRFALIYNGVWRLERAAEAMQADLAVSATFRPR